MTEAEWLACADPAPMLDFVESRASGCKLRLFAVACCRRAWHLMTDPRHRDAIQAAERLADAPLTDAEVEAILEPVVDLWAALPAATANEWSPDHYMTGATRHLGTLGGARYAASYVARGLGCAAGKKGSPEWRAVEQAEEAAQCQLLRD